MSTGFLTAVSRSPGCPLSPFFFSETGTSYQQVPDSPLHGINMRVHRIRESSLSPGATVPEVGSPLLRKIITSKKRACSSPQTGSAKSSKRPYEVLSVPNYVAHSERMPPAPKTQEQVVPGCSPLGVFEDESCDIQRRLPCAIKEGTKPLELFFGDNDIFASREE